MSDEERPWSFDEALRAIAEEVARGIQRVQETDFEELAREYGFDPDHAKQFFDTAGDWVRAQAEAFNGPSAPVRWEDPLHGAGPSPLDVPTDEQGRALAALESGRWRVEPGTSALAAVGDGPGPRDALGLVRELRVRDWIDADGHVTLTGHAALQRWLETTD